MKTPALHPHRNSRFTRRGFLAGTGGLLVLGLAGCGGAGGGSGTGGSSNQTRVIEHKYGRAEVEGAPERVVSLGFQEHDFLYALGVKPVAVRWWYGDEDDVIYPWAEDEAGGADPEILEMSNGLNLEKIAALEPDLLVGLYSGMTGDDYETLSQIAPTVAQSRDYIDYGMPWQETTAMLGRAVGRKDRAEEIVSGLEARFERVREEHPEWEGKSLAIGTYSDDTFGVFASEDPRSRFFRSLGFEIPDRFDKLAEGRFYAELSAERVELLDADVLVWDQVSFVDGGRETIETEPLVRQLAAMQDGRAIFLEGEIEDAFGWQTVLSMPFALGRIVPMLEGAMGDRATGQENGG